MFQGLQEDQLAGALEAMLFVTDEPVGTIALAEMLECEVGAVEAALVRLRDGLEARGSGIQLREVAGGWRLFTHPAYHELIEKYVLSWDTRKLSAAAMETLAIVAYAQPVTRAGVASVRGVNSDSSINSLVEKGLVREVGTEDAPGNPVLYGTTRGFLEKFGLRSPADLPDLADFAPDEEPGRIRCYPLLKALYGADQRSVERGIVRTLFGGKTKVRLAAPAAEAFQRIDAAWKLRPADPELNSYFSPIYGYFWRAIAKTNRLSPHSFGIAVDLNPDKGPYWQWSKLRPHPLQKTFPSAIVSLFEDNGFIWGGKWEHFDLMHFEYRPELIIKAKKLRAQANGEKPEDAS